jgi:putative nucleotidyltransferase with HDIG domain
MMEKPHYISPDQLRVGLYVHIDLGWMDHPFTFNNFKIKDEGQIAELRKLNLAKLRYDPLRSDCEPLPTPPPSAATEPPAAPAIEKTDPTSPEAGLKASPEVSPEARTDARQLRLAELHSAIQACEKKYVKAATEVRQIEKDVLLNPPKSVQQAQTLVNGMVESLLTEGEVVLHALQPKPGAAETYTHSLNVTVISLVLAKSLDITEDDATHLGIGAIFHDVGKAQIPDRISKKTDALSKAEISLMQQHCTMGAKFATDTGINDQIVRIILQHHECMDGSGYPAKLKMDQIDRLARIVFVANLYDNLCNPLNVAQAMTPYEALSHMFAHQRSKCDPAILKLLIKSFGVYPPGSLVRLSDGEHGIVISVNPNKPLRPFVLMHAPDVPRDTPLLINLGEEASISITHCLRQNQLPKDVFDYLQPSTRINYYFDKETSAEA